MTGRDIVFDPVFPEPLIWLLGAFVLGITAILYLQVARRLGRVRSLILLVLRVTALVLLILLLLQPSVQREKRRAPHNRQTLVAIDTSLSMQHADAGHETRLEIAKRILDDSRLTEKAAGGDDNSSAGVLFFEFNEDAQRITARQLDALNATGDNTFIHRSVETILSDPGAAEANALILLSDGHDFEMISPFRTARAAKSHRVPVYAVPIGSASKVRDAAVRISNYQPYSYINQSCRISALLRLIGCEYETLTVQLLRGDRIVETRQINTGEEAEIPVDFVVTEPEVGQFEFEVRVKPADHESDAGNNSAITYLNVIDEKIRALLLEGSPYWDTTFLQRSLFENDKIDLDSLLLVSEARVQPVRNDDNRGPLNLPASQADFNRYDCIILGKSLDPMLGPSSQPMLRSYVEDYGGILIFARGAAFEEDSIVEQELLPVTWDLGGNRNIGIEVARDGRSAAPFRILHGRLHGVNALPPLIASRRVSETKSLASTLLSVQDPESGSDFPAIVHRRYGRGQVLSIGVQGLWRWAFNAKTEKENNVFDLFWDQLLLWLLSRGDIVPNQNFSFRASTANLLLGEKVFFRLGARDPQSTPLSLSVPLFHEGIQTAEITLEKSGEDSFLAGFVPEKTGRYHAQVTLPGGEKSEAKFMVYEEKQETTEIAADISYLRKICQDSGGRLLTPEELRKLALTLNDTSATAEPELELAAIWDRPWVYYLIGAFLGADWFLRRRWGLL